MEELALRCPNHVLGFALPGLCAASEEKGKSCVSADQPPGENSSGTPLLPPPVPYRDPDSVYTSFLFFVNSLMFICLVNNPPFISHYPQHCCPEYFLEKTALAEAMQTSTWRSPMYPLGVSRYYTAYCHLKS